MAINYTYPVKAAPTSADDILIIDNSDDSKATKRVKISTLPISGVTSIVAGTNVTISPVGGTGDVTINSSGGGGITLTTVGTSGVSTLTGTTLNIPDYGSGVVTSVTATTPLSSTGGATPDISLGIVPINKGGTGLSTIGTNNTVLTSNGTTASWSTTALSNYLPLAGGTMTGSINNVSLVQLKEQALPDASGAPTPTFNAANGAYANISADGAITTFTITVMPNGITSKLFITTSPLTNVGTWVDSNGGAIKWQGGSAPVLSTSPGVDIITFEFSQGLVYGSIIQGYA